MGKPSCLKIVCILHLWMGQITDSILILSNHKQPAMNLLIRDAWSYQLLLLSKLTSIKYSELWTCLGTQPFSQSSEQLSWCTLREAANSHLHQIDVPVYPDVLSLMIAVFGTSLWGRTLDAPQLNLRLPGIIDGRGSSGRGGPCCLFYK